MTAMGTPTAPRSPFGFPGRSGPPPFPFLPFHEGTTALPPRPPGGKFPVEMVPTEMLAVLAAGALSVVSQMFRRWNSRSAPASRCW